MQIDDCSCPWLVFYSIGLLEIFPYIYTSWVATVQQKNLMRQYPRLLQPTLRCIIVYGLNKNYIIIYKVHLYDTTIIIVRRKQDTRRRLPMCAVRIVGIMMWRRKQIAHLTIILYYLIFVLRVRVYDLNSCKRFLPTNDKFQILRLKLRLGVAIIQDFTPRFSLQKTRDCYHNLIVYNIQYYILILR